MSARVEGLRDDGSARAARSARIIRATVALPGGEERDVIVRNLSTCGIGATCRSLAPIKGERISVRLPGGIDARGVVRWVKGQAFGVALEQELDIAAIELALQHKLTQPVSTAAWEVEPRHKVYRQAVDPATLRRV